LSRINPRPDDEARATKGMITLGLAGRIKAEARRRVTRGAQVASCTVAVTLKASCWA